MELQNTRSHGERPRDGLNVRPEGASLTIASQGSPSGDTGFAEQQGPDLPESPAQFSTPDGPAGGYTDNRAPWEWQSKYPEEARREIKYEVRRLLVYLGVSVGVAAFSLALSGQVIKITLPLSAISVDGNSLQPLALTISCQVVALYFVGCVGGTTFSLKWLVHACARGKWHLDRRPWRLLIPLLGGVYACVVLALMDAGMIGHEPATSHPLLVSAALAFLVGYFSDGVSGLLSNIANAVFGTLEKK